MGNQMVSDRIRGKLASINRVSYGHVPVASRVQTTVRVSSRGNASRNTVRSWSVRGDLWMESVCSLAAWAVRVERPPVGTEGREMGVRVEGRLLKKAAMLMVSGGNSQLSSTSSSAVSCRERYAASGTEAAYRWRRRRRDQSRLCAQYSISVPVGSGYPR
jgi:hypothetical protein